MSKNISAVIIDTYENKKMPQIAIEKTLQCRQIKKIYTFSDVPFYGGAEFIQIPKITSIKDYEDLVLGGLLEYVQEDILVIQWDGFVLQPNNWDDRFQDFDYIGAPFIYRNNIFEVGNGGFSYRSLRLMEMLYKITKSPNRQISSVPEDVQICMELRATLEQEGIKFAPLNVASQFAFQDGGLKVDFEKLFGFHSPWNLPTFFNEEGLIFVVKDIIERITNFRILILYLEQCKSRQFNHLLTESMRIIKQTPAISEIVNRKMEKEPDLGWVARYLKVTQGII
jgi:hypothetical protein